MTPKNINLFFEALEKAIPNPQTELIYTNPYTLLVAVVLSAQSTDKGVNRATQDLFKIVHTPSDMIHYGEENLKNTIKTIGLYKTKAKNIIKLSHILEDRFKGTVPATREELESLPGVGRKTANVVLNVIFGLPTFAVDTHIFRVSNRTGLAVGKTPLAVEKILENVVPEKFRHSAHHLLILHGRYTCKAQKPLCPACPVKNLCSYTFKTQEISPKSI
ncbi:MAG: endonuclease III [Proteobacteria bacterium]|nr:endonuclease III [Pseudomonadota bacterium]